MLVTMLRPLTSMVMNSAAQGAWPTLAAAAAPEVESAQYFGPGRNGEWSGPAREVRPHGKAKRIEPAKRLWEISEKMTGVTYPV